MKNFLYYFSDREVGYIRLSFFIKHFPASDFKFDDHLIYRFLEYCSELRVPVSINASNSYIKTKLVSDIKKYMIRTPETGKLDYNSPQGLIEAKRVLSTSLSLILENYLEPTENTTEFNLEFSEWLQEKSKELVTQVAVELHEKSVSDAADMAIDDVIEESTAKLASIRAKYSQELVTRMTEIVEATPFLASSDGASSLVFSLDGFGEFTDKAGQFFGGTVNIIAGTPGTGKTRFTLGQIVYPFLAAGKNVRYENYEEGSRKISSCLVAKHIAAKYGLIVNSKNIEANELDQITETTVEAARRDLFKSGNYGKLYLGMDDNDLSGTSKLYAENIELEMTEYFKNNRHITLWVIDYLGIVAYRKAQNVVDAIRTAVEQIHAVKKRCPWLTIVVLSQFSKEGQFNAIKGLPFLQGDLQGGGVVDQYADSVIRLAQNDAQKAAKIYMNMDSGKSRHTEGNVSCVLQSNYAICNFRLFTP